MMTFKKQQQGFTIAELLIAAVLGLFLTAVVITVFTSSQNTFRASTEVSRAQENTRFAHSFLTRNIRLAGYSNCSNDVAIRNFLNLDSDAYVPAIEHGVFGWEFGGTGAGVTYDLNYESLNGDFTDAGGEDNAIKASFHTNSNPLKVPANSLSKYFNN